MNIFYLSPDPKQAAEYHLDKHVVKMILESAQLLCTSHRILDGSPRIIQKITRTNKLRNVKRFVFDDITKETLFYNASHVHHPCAVWVRMSINNYMWLYELFVALCDEYTFRYGKKHKTDLMLRESLKSTPINNAHSNFTIPPQAMPIQYKHSDAVVAYRNYYIGAKASFAKWTKRPMPFWFTTGDNHANV